VEEKEELLKQKERLVIIKKEAKKFDEGKPGFSNIPRLALLEVLW